MHLFSCDDNNNPQIQPLQSGKSFTISIKHYKEAIMSNRGKEISRTRWRSWVNFKVSRGSHDSIPREIAGY